MIYDLLPTINISLVLFRISLPFSHTCGGVAQSPSTRPARIRTADDSLPRVNSRVRRPGRAGNPEQQLHNSGRGSGSRGLPLLTKVETAYMQKRVAIFRETRNGSVGFHAPRGLRQNTRPYGYSGVVALLRSFVASRTPSASATRKRRRLVLSGPRRAGSSENQRGQIYLSPFMR